MRAGPVAQMASVVWALCACAPASGPAASHPVEEEARRLGPAAREGVALAERIPAQATRCVTSTTLPLNSEQRALMMLVSQTDSLPWALELPVVAYVRARVRTRGGFQTLVWVEVGPEAEGPERIRASLDLALGTRLRWEGEPMRCDNPVDCGDTLASFESPRVVRLVKGRGPVPEGDVDNPCARLRREFPDALEVASWRHDSAFAGDMGLTRTDQVIAIRGAGLTKLRRRHYTDDQHQVAAYREALFGVDEVPLIAGLPVEPYREVQGRTLIERTDVLWDDLRLVVEDHSRQRRLSEVSRARHMLSAQSLQSLRDQAQLMFAGLEHKVPSERREAARLLAAWLMRARRLHPRDEALASVQYRVFLDELGDARGALSVAEEMLRGTGGDVRAWQLSRRRALAHLGAEELTPALRDDHGLDAAQAARMADEVTAAIARGEGFERAEWAWLTARELSQTADGLARVGVDRMELPLSSLPRALSYLATRSPALRGTYGIHVMVNGRLVQADASAQRSTWAGISRAGSRPAWVGAASALDDTQLRELGDMLGAALEDGPLRLLVSVRALGAPSKDAANVLIDGRLRGDTLTVEHMDRRAASLSWPRIDRLLVQPLTRLSSRGFPPDELRVPAQDAATAAEMVAWGSSESGVTCQHVEHWVVCRGPMHDSGAALRALLRIDDRELGAQSLKLWGSETH